MPQPIPSNPPSPTPQPQSTLPQLLRLSWSAAPPMPQGLQDNDGGVVDGYLVMVGGFCGGYEDDWKPGMYPRGFLRKTWALDLAHEEQGWIELPDLPGAARQDSQAISVGDQLYLWGGFSYTEPCCYTDGFKLSRREGEWIWEALPPLPWPLSAGGICAIGSQIYVFSGQDYDDVSVYTETDRHGKVARLGARLLVFDTAEPQEGWQELPPCPGTPRGAAGVAAVGGKVYAIGGCGVKQAGPEEIVGREADGGQDAFEGQHTMHCVVDSWCYDPQTETWQRLRDLPVAVAGFPSGQLAYRDRYILLPCGYAFDTILNPDGTIRPRYGRPSQIDRSGWRMHPTIAASKMRSRGYYNHVWAYDTQTDLYGTATKLPYDDHTPPTYVIGDTVYMFADETSGFFWEDEYFGHHSEFVLKGEIELIDKEGRDV